jgi:2-(1,2-epoxy-1,2-dihydrophenyl)acetyl-CoA isomerase
MDEPLVLYRVEDSIGWLTLNRPAQHNAMDDAMIQQLNAHIEAANVDPAVRVLVLHGAGKSFCSGFAVSTFGSARALAGEPEPPPRRPHVEDRPVIRMRQSDKVIIGAIHGNALGAGYGLALGCDLRLAAEDARLGAIHVKRGIPVDGCLTYLLPRAIGTQKGLYYMLTGELISGREAEQLGLVLKAVPADQLLEEARRLALKIAAGPPLAQAFIKRAAYRHENTTIEDASEFEILAVMRCFHTEDAREGVAAFKEKREPVFKGR